MKLFYSDAYVRAAHSFDTVRKSAAIGRSLYSDPIAAVEVVAPEPATAAVLTSVHSTEYVHAVETGQPAALAESQGFPWDPGVWESTTASTGGCLAAARAALTDGAAGSLSSGLHHARHNRGTGFCTFNGLAVAARTVAGDTHSRVLIVDLDAHCGGGTASLIAGHEQIVQIDVAVSAFDTYAPAAGQGSLDIVRHAGDYLHTVRARLEEAPRDVALVLYNAGMDPHDGCDVGGLRGIDAAMLAERERLVFCWASNHRLPIAFVIAGGYTGERLSSEQLIALHRSTITAAAAAAGAW